MSSKYSTHTILGIVTVFSVDNNAVRTLRLGTSPSSLSYCSSALESSQSYKSYPALGLCACAEDVFDIISALF